MTIYQQIAQDIKKAIDSREMKAGDKIPSVSELRKHYQVSHITVLRAYTELTEQKYIQMKKQDKAFHYHYILFPPLLFAANLSEFGS